MKRHGIKKMNMFSISVKLFLIQFLFLIVTLYADGNLIVNTNKSNNLIFEFTTFEQMASYASFSSVKIEDKIAVKPFWTDKKYYIIDTQKNTFNSIKSNFSDYNFYKDYGVHYDAMEKALGSDEFKEKGITENLSLNSNFIIKIDSETSYTEVYDNIYKKYIRKKIIKYYLKISKKTETEYIINTGRILNIQRGWGTDYPAVRIEENYMIHFEKFDTEVAITKLVFESSEKKEIIIKNVKKIYHITSHAPNNRRFIYSEGHDKIKSVFLLEEKEFIVSNILQRNTTSTYTYYRIFNEFGAVLNNRYKNDMQWVDKYYFLPFGNNNLIEIKSWKIGTGYFNKYKDYLYYPHCDDKSYSIIKMDKAGNSETIYENEEGCSEFSFLPSYEDFLLINNYDESSNKITWKLINIP